MRRFRHNYSMGIKARRFPTVNTTGIGKMSHAMPKRTVDSALPPMEAELISPRIPPRFSSGIANISVALKMPLPKVLAKALKNSSTQADRKSVSKYAAVEKTRDAKNPASMT